MTAVPPAEFEDRLKRAGRAVQVIMPDTPYMVFAFNGTRSGGVSNMQQADVLRFLKQYLEKHPSPS